MKRIMIVEDEHLEREFMLNTVSEAVASDVHVHAYETGEQALEQFAKQHYDIAFIDVNMPGMNGLELVKILKDIKPDLIFFIVTSYNYFDYALEAMRLDVTDYLLKPTKQETITNALNNIYQSGQDPTPIIQQEALIKKRNQKDLVYALLIEKQDSTIRMLSRKLGIDLKGISNIIMHQDDAPAYEANIPKSQYYLRFDHGSLCIYTFLYDCTNQVSDYGIIVYSQYHNSLSIALNDYFISIRSDFNIASIYDYKKLVDYFFNTDFSSALKINIISEYISFQLFKKSEKEIYEYIETLQAQFITACNDNGVYIPNNLVFVTQKQFSMNTKLIEIQMIIDQIAKTYYDRVVNVDEDLDTDIVIRISQYIENHYAKNIGLDDMCQDLDVSPYHISKVLSMSDTSFTEMLNDVRIHKAKELLGTHMNIKEISYAVGYRSSTYFSRVFKKYTDLTPTQYQTQMHQ